MWYEVVKSHIAYIICYKLKPLWDIIFPEETELNVNYSLIPHGALALHSGCQIHSLFSYDDETAKKIISKAKFYKEELWPKSFCKVATTRLLELFPEGKIIIVPMASQILELPLLNILAVVMSDCGDRIEVVPALKYRAHTSQKSRMTRERRLSNKNLCFDVCERSINYILETCNQEATQIIILDDVVTTGETLFRAREAITKKFAENLIDKDVFTVSVFH